MADPLSDADARRFPWRAAFHKTTAAVFVVGPTGRLRYANPAWESLTGKSFAKLRGMRISARRSASPLGQALAPPPEAWAGRSAAARRLRAEADTGPPWWELTFLPLPGPAGRPIAIVGTITVVGEPVPKAIARAVPTAVAEIRRAHAKRFTPDLFADDERLQTQIRLAAQTNVPVYLIGEPGTGKETLARVIHHTGPVSDRPFIAIECGGVQPYLVEGLLFGKGGLTAGRIGTLYLHEPAGLPRDLQERIAGIVAPPRLICGATRTAAEDVATGRLIPPFHTELSVLELRLKPLRDRLNELPRIVDRLPASPRVADDVWPTLRAYRWPGNLWELADVLAQAATRAEAGPITREHLPRYLKDHELAAAAPPPTGEAWTLDGVLEAVERRLIELALRRANGSQTDAAAALGVVRARLARRIDTLGIGKGN